MGNSPEYPLVNPEIIMTIPTLITLNCSAWALLVVEPYRHSLLPQTDIELPRFSGGSSQLNATSGSHIVPDWS